jgi:predicted O-methyltransferase YrrM
MRLGTIIYRVFSYFRHVLTAWNTTGEGVHSPSLFYIVRFLFRDKNSYYCFAEIERVRTSLMANHESVQVVDYGSCGSPSGLQVEHNISDIARNQLECARVQQVLFRLLAYMNEEERRPLEVLELGTSLGITTAYLASVDSRNRVMSFEGSSSLVSIARKQWQLLGLENIECIEGRIEDTLYNNAHARIDLAYVDANHTYQATIEYVGFLFGRMSKNGIIIVDDIHYSREMYRAWEELKRDERVTSTMDLFYVGLIFVNPYYMRRHYKIRL